MPFRFDVLSEPFALHYCFSVSPDDSQRGYQVTPADLRQYNKQMLDKLANASLEEIGLVLGWHLQKATDPESFVEFVRSMVKTDAEHLTAWDFIAMDVSPRNFESTYTWLEIKKASMTGAVAIQVRREEAPEEGRFLTHRAYMLILLVSGLPEQLDIEGLDKGKKSEFLADLINLSVRKTGDILRAKSEFSNFYPYAPKVIDEVYNHFKEMKILNTKIGKAVVKLKLQGYNSKNK